MPLGGYSRKRLKRWTEKHCAARRDAWDSEAHVYLPSVRVLLLLQLRSSLADSAVNFDGVLLVRGWSTRTKLMHRPVCLAVLSPS
ncbi:hypothetical protein RSP795_21280 [Ralstonia solanacearum]|nr:hypothetical protein RSP795_21280 [Ralstonia solanacearum]